MAKLTLAQLKTLVDTVVDADKIGVDAPFEPDVDSITGLLVKIGKQFMLDSNFEDRLPELEFGDLPFGTTVEEYFIDLTLPVIGDPTGANNTAPKRPTFQDVAYSYELDLYQVETTVDKYKMQHAMLGQEEFTTLVAQIMKRLYDSMALYRYGVKRQLIGRFISVIPDAKTSMWTKQAIPTDTSTGEVFIKSVKKKVEQLKLLVTDNNNLLGVPARADDLVLYVKPEILPAIDVDVLAGSFNPDKVEIPVTVKVLEDFGTITNPEDSNVERENAYALLVDTRGLRVYTHTLDTDSDHNGRGGFTNFYLKWKPVCHYSKAVNAHVWTFDSPEE